MKSTLALLILLASSFAFACPELAGTYVCTSEDGQKQEVLVSQKVVNNVTIYNLDGDEFAADGIKRPLDSEDMIGTFAVTCESDKVKVVSDAVAKDNSFSGHQEGYIYRTTSGIRQDSKITYTADGQSQDFEMSMECLSK